MVGDLRAVADLQLPALGRARDRRPGGHGVRAAGLRQPPGLGEQRGQVGPGGRLGAVVPRPRCPVRARDRPGTRVRVRRGGGRGRRYVPCRAHAQRQPVHQWTAVHPRPRPPADVRRAVARVEACRERKGLLARVDGEFGRGPRAPGRSRHRPSAEAEPGQAVHHQGGHGHVVELAARVAGVREVGGPLGEQFQGARLVPRQRAELHVVRVGRAHALHGAHQTQAPEMMGTGLLQAAQAQQRDEGGGQYGVRLVGAAVLALQDRAPQLQGLRAGVALGPPPSLAVQFARVAVRHAVPVGGQPGGMGPLRSLRVPQVRGHAELGTTHGPFGVTGEPVAVLHLAEPLLYGGERDVRLVEHAGRHPLEDPVQRVDLVLVEVLGVFVPQAQQAREGDEHLVLLGAVVVDLQLVSERFDHGERDVQLLRLGEQLFRARVAGGPLRLLVVVPHRLAQGVEVHGRAAHPRSSSPVSVWVAHSRRPMNERFRSAESAGRSGRCAIRRAWP